MLEVRREPSSARNISSQLSITGSDGRCVQKPGTYSSDSDEIAIQGIPHSRRIITMTTILVTLQSQMIPHPLLGRLSPLPKNWRQKHDVCSNVVRVQPRKSRSITDLHWAPVSMRLEARIILISIHGQSPFFLPHPHRGQRITSP